MDLEELEHEWRPSIHPQIHLVLVGMVLGVVGMHIWDVVVGW